jgi:uncharacterized MAPEG superfamily protein
MKLELMLLLWSVALTFAQMLVAVSGATLQVGLPMLAGNREPVPVFGGWVGRAQRAHHNMLESLVLFAILVLLAEELERLNAMTRLGAQLFFWARLAYAFAYMAGIPYLRTGVWLVSMIGLILIFVQLL